MKALITGGNGFIGSAVVREILRSGYSVRCMVRAASDTRRLAGLNVELVQGDVRSGEEVLRAMRDCDAVIHLAAPSSWKEIDSPHMRQVVVDGTENVLRSARSLGVLRSVYVSSLVAIGGTTAPQILNEQSPWTLTGKNLRYASAKHDAETACLRCAADGLPVVVVNPAEVYGPHDRKLITSGNLLDFARANPVPVCNGGTSITHVDDVAGGIVAALVRGRSGERYILGGENVSIRQIASLTLEILGLRRRTICFPNFVVRAVTRIGTAMRIPLPFDPNVVPYATRYWYADSSKAQTELGFRFRTARDTIASALAWLQNEGLLPPDCQVRDAPAVVGPSATTAQSAEVGEIDEAQPARNRCESQLATTDTHPRTG